MERIRPALSAIALLVHLLLAPLVSAAPAAADTVRLVAFGDSLTAGYGLSPREAFPARLEAALKARGHDVAVVNAGVSGDTVAAGLARVDWTFSEPFDGAIVELGANDALRGLDPARTRADFDRLVGRIAETGKPILIAGMLAPPNLGEDYGRAFNSIFPDTAEKYGALLYPFFLDGVVADRRLNQPDGIHPTAEGVDIIVERILPSVEDLLRRIEAAG
ncbi:arylesterase [Chthonobacter rhizosphaerae]|uniref:arylesterase n=1 Tax=Chthonobacter rhizosphaerae TaxID=2735553 RepID=UPI0015EF7B85|nr:arylesterase [Chthonobacter rhizosphaerae]